MFDDDVMDDTEDPVVEAPADIPRLNPWRKVDRCHIRMRAQ